MHQPAAFSATRTPVAAGALRASNARPVPIGPYISTDAAGLRMQSFFCVLNPVNFVIFHPRRAPI